jgi:hypothetical protein
MRKVLFGLLVLVQSSTGFAFACSGADPSVRAVQTGMSANGGINHYTISISVTNRGNKKQASNVLQFVDIVQEGIRRDAHTIPPLRPGQTFTTSYIYNRSSDAGAGTTMLTLRLNMRQPASPGIANCSTGNDSATVTF